MYVCTSINPMLSHSKDTKMLLNASLFNPNH